MWSWSEPGGNEIVSGNERVGPNLLRGHVFKFLFGELIECEVTVAAEAVKPVQRKMLFKFRQTKKTFESGFLHAHNVAKAHVVGHERAYLLSVFIGHPKPVATVGEIMNSSTTPPALATLARSTDGW